MMFLENVYIYIYLYNPNVLYFLYYWWLICLLLFSCYSLIKDIFVDIRLLLDLLFRSKTWIYCLVIWLMFISEYQQYVPDIS